MLMRGSQKSDTYELSVNHRQSLLSDYTEGGTNSVPDNLAKSDEKVTFEWKQKKKPNQLGKGSAIYRETFAEGSEIAAMHQILSDDKLKAQQPITEKNKFRKMLKEFIKQIPVFDPNSKGIVTWNIITSVLVLFYFYEIPIYIAWTSIFWTEILPKVGVETFTTCSYVILTLDVALEFMTSYYQHGNLVTKKAKIANNYLRGNLFYDLIAIGAFTFRVNLATDHYRYMYLLFYCKLPSLKKTFNEFDEMILLHRATRTSFQIAKIMLFMFFAFFTFGCFFNILGRWCQDRNEQSWLTVPGNFGIIAEMDVHQQFFFSLYFSMGTMSSTMGYGDITPRNVYECSYCLGGIIFAVMIFAININSIFKVIDEHNVTHLKNFRTRIAINQFMRNKQVPRELSERVRQYLNEHWYEEGSRDHELEKQTIESLAPELREELMLNSYGKFLMTTEMFSKNFSRHFLKCLALEIEEVAYSQGETIFSDRGKGPDLFSGFYYVANGSILIYPTLSGKDPQNIYLKKLKTGEFFGEHAFITGQARCAAAVAHSYSLVYRISRDSFIETLKRFPEDYEKFCQMKDSIMLQQDLTPLGTSCWTCDSHTHYSTNCPITHYCPSTQKVVDLDIQVLQTRKQFERYDRAQWPTRKNQSKLVKLRKGKQTVIERFANALKSKQQIIMEQSQMKQSVYSPGKLPQKSQQEGSAIRVVPVPVGMDASEVQMVNEAMINTPQQLEMQRQFAQFKQPKIQTGMLDFDKPTFYKTYNNEGNIQNIWSQTGQLIRK